MQEVIGGVCRLKMVRLGGEFLAENFKLGFRFAWKRAFLEREKLQYLVFLFLRHMFYIGGLAEK